jgi:ubiquinone/menaquinone biosynthesis C-methylase UbiE
MAGDERVLERRLEDPSADLWSEWLLHRRHGDDAAYGAFVQSAIDAYADRVLDAAHLEAGMTLADIGAGDGLVAFRAIDRIGPSLRVILADISPTLLRHAEALAVQRVVRDQCTFIECAADQLHAIADATVDVIATRAVLAYVADKTACLREFYRVLKPGGRITVAEPVFQDEAFYVRALRTRIEAQGFDVADRFPPLLHRWKAAQFPDTADGIASSPLVNYSERDLLDIVQAAGYTDLRLQLHIDVMSSPITSWEVFLGVSPHPWAPPLRTILAERFTPDERQYFEAMVRPGVESGGNIVTTRVAYLQGRKPPTRDLPQRPHVQQRTPSSAD